MGDIINLRTARKRASRREKERRAAENRKLYGRSKAEGAGEDARRDHARRLLDAHRIETGDGQ